jgi:hypothetical protein
LIFLTDIPVLSAPISVVVALTILIFYVLNAILSSFFNFLLSLFSYFIYFFFNFLASSGLTSPSLLSWSLYISSTTSNGFPFLALTSFLVYTSSAIKPSNGTLNYLWSSIYLLGLMILLVLITAGWLSVLVNVDRIV